MTVDEFNAAVEAKYAWPGGYPLYLVVEDGGLFCMNCAAKEAERMREALKTPSHEDRDWSPAYIEINWEDDLECNHCDKAIERAYD